MSQPADWVVSTSVRAPCAAAAARTAARSAIRPSADWTAENATSAVPGRTASARSASGAYRSLRSPRTENGVITELKSPSGTRTSAPVGSEAAISPTWIETPPPVATRSAGDTGEPGEGGTGGADGLEVPGTRPAPARVLLGQRVHGVDGPAGQQTATGGVEIGRLGRELGASQGVHEPTLEPAYLIVNRLILMSTPKQSL